MLYYLTEIGFDTTLETGTDLIRIADTHCQHYEERNNWLPIKDMHKAKAYLERFGFKITEVTV